MTAPGSSAGMVTDASAGYDVGMSTERPDADQPRQFDHKPNVSLIQEFWEFLRANKMWWMAPIILVALLLAGIVVLGSTGAAPFIYTLF